MRERDSWRGSWVLHTIIIFSDKLLNLQFPAENESAKMREAVLDKSIAVLRQTYIKLVEQGKICNACSDSSDEEAAKKEPAE